MSNHNLKLTPRDLLFMHDARPMEASDAGLGAYWPRPDQLGNAIINAFHNQWPEMQDWEGDEHTARPLVRHEDGHRTGDVHADTSSFRFGALMTAGPFPMKDGKMYFPCPLDLSADADGNLTAMALVSAADTNMPKPLTMAFQARNLGKQTPPRWIAAEDYARYLKSETFQASEPELYSAERNIGVAIDAATGAAAEGQLYQAEYLRLAEDVSLAFQASCDIKPKRHPELGLVDVFDKLGLPSDIIIGGQQGVARMEELPDGIFQLPKAERDASSRFIRWTLLTPMVSTEGWLPSWIKAEEDKAKGIEAGAVMLKERPERNPGESRDAWRRRIKDAPQIKARLVAARVGKPLAFSGWDIHEGGPKPTVLAVPAGSAYVFECGSPEDAAKLWQAIDCQGTPALTRLSSQFGERGFGLGVCSSIKVSK